MAIVPPLGVRVGVVRRRRRHRCSRCRLLAALLKHVSKG